MRAFAGSGSDRQRAKGVANTPERDVDDLIRHWLLNLAVDSPMSVGMLFPAVDGEALNVYTLPGRSSEDYARGLTELFDAGMIKLRRWNWLPGSSEIAEDDVE